MRAGLGLFNLLVATVGAEVTWSAATDTRAVLIATRDLPAGATLTAADLGVAHLHADEAVSQAALPATLEDQLVGKPLAAPAFAHQVLVRGQISPLPALGEGYEAFSVPVSADTAAGEHLQPGDAVRVYATMAKGTSAAKTSVIVDQAIVLALSDEPSAGAGSLDSAPVSGSRSGVRALTLRLTPQQLQALAFARWNGDLDIALLPPPTGSP